MNRQLTITISLIVLMIVVSACGTAAIPEYEQDETRVAVARTVTREALLTAGAIIPTDTPTVTPSPTIDFAATDAAIQATANAEATTAAELEATAQAEAAQATADAQATIDAMPTEIGADDPLFDEIAAADPANGEALFAANPAGACTACHNVDSEEGLVGPGQYNVFERTVERLENGTIEDDGPYSYLYHSIINPNDYIVEGYTANIMPMTYGDNLSEQEIYDIVAYLAQLGD